MVIPAGRRRLRAGRPTPTATRAARSSRPTSTAARRGGHRARAAGHLPHRRRAGGRERREGGPREQLDDDGKTVKVAGPSTPVQVLAWTNVPRRRRVPGGRRRAPARDIAGSRAARERRRGDRLAAPLHARGPLPGGRRGRAADAQPRHQGRHAAGAGRGRRRRVGQRGVRTRIVHKGVGAVTRRDVNLASTAEAIIIAFDIPPRRPTPARRSRSRASTCASTR